jgi:iron complex outermembrane receptor protein
MRLFLLFFLLLLESLYAKEDLSSLLASYKQESELSKITKKEEAGVIDIYTRHDLEAMQAKTLQDVLRILPGFYLTRTTNNLTSLQKPTLSSVQLTSIRLYINDHDMSSSSFGSAFLVWGELPIEYIDHIEVYKGASSIEFGNETGSIIMKLYTKTPKREEGGKIRLYGDDYGSTNIDTYIASDINDFSYFAYANINNINRTKYTQTYQNQNYSLDSDHSGHNFYANLQYQKWILELGAYSKKSDDFLGIGINRTPTGGGLDTYHRYMHLTKKFSNDIKLQFSYDNASYDRIYIDPNGIGIANGPIVNYYHLKFDDEIFSATLEKKIEYNAHSLLFGTFYKKKKFSENGDFSQDSGDYLYINSFDNALDFYSLYSEYTYDYNSNTRLIASLKEDIFRYNKDIPSRSEFTTKLGVIKHIDNFQIKTFLTSSYIPTAFYQLYNPDNTPYKTNPNLDNMHLIIGTLSLKYKKNRHRFKFVIAKNQIKDIIVYNKALPYGYTNSSKTANYLRLEAKYSYIFDINNKFLFDIFKGENNNDIEVSPKYGSIIQLFTKYKKFEIYNELTYKSAYDYYGLSMDASYNYTASVKYHYTKDLSLGVRGENIFDSGYKQAYYGVDYAIPVTDQKIWFNLEYLF